MRRTALALLVVLLARAAAGADDGWDAQAARFREAMRSPRPADRDRALGAVRDLVDARTPGLLVEAASALSAERDRAEARAGRDAAEADRVLRSIEKEAKAFEQVSGATGVEVARHADRMADLRDRCWGLESSAREAGAEAARARSQLDGVGQAAAAVLVRLGPEDAARAVERLRTAWLVGPGADVEDGVRFVDALTPRAGPETAMALAALATDEARDPRVRAVAVDARAQRRDAGALEDSIALLASPAWPVQAAAIEALRSLHRREAIEPLIAYLGRDDLGRLREDAHRALRSLTGERHGPYRQPWEDWWADARRRFTPPAGPTPTARLLEPEGGVTFYGITTFSRRIVFVLDVSASMAEPERTSPRGPVVRKVDAALRELEGAVAALDDGGRFDVLLFERGVTAWQPSLARSDRASRERALAWAAGHEPHGPTNLYDALREAVRLCSGLDAPRPPPAGADTVFLLTDGHPTAGRVEDPGRLLAEVRRWNRTARATVHCVGLGDHDAALLSGIAATTGGRYVSR